MSPDLVDVLLGEHAVFYAQFDHVETLTSARRDVATLHAWAAMIAEALVSHARLEEDLLFRPLEGVAEASAPLSVMRDEHVRIEEALARVSKTHSHSDAAGDLREAVGLSREHFRKEEVVLFPLARGALGPARLAAAAAEWAIRRGVTFAEL